MADPEREACASLALVTDALAALGDALAAGDLAATLALEPTLAVLAADLAAAASAPSPLPITATPSLDAARHALHRCERLGEGIDRFLNGTLAAQGRPPHYARHGRCTSAGAPAHALATRA